MDSKETVDLGQGLELDSAIYATLGECTDHVQALISLKGNDLRFVFKDHQDKRAFMRKPLSQHWADLAEIQQQDLKRTLQYLLNIDESIPYVENSRNPNLKEKKGSVAQHIRDGSQDALVPYDGYELCEWMWEILFKNEDWHTDVSHWTVADRLKKRTTNTYS